jgi:L-asparaginase II
MLILAHRLGVATDGYAQLEHPVQQAMLAVVARMAELDPSDISTGIDGCGVPVFNLPLERLALAYAKLGTQSGAAATICEALALHPEYLAGEDRYDTQLIRVTNGRVLGKMGAEGVFALTIPAKKIGVAIKIEDGNFRALYPAVTETLMQLNILSKSEYQALNDWHNPILFNHAGTEVGKIVPCFNLD